LKMGGGGGVVNGNSANLIPTHTYVDRQPSYGYDPLTHGGYRVVDDYAAYPHMPQTPSQVDDYHNMRNSQNPSRQDYGSEPYAAVHKPKKRLDQHMGEYSPYHDVSGLPEHQYHTDVVDHHDDNQSRQMSQHSMPLNYDDSVVENDYTLSNSRNRRVIHEIIV